MYLRIAALQAVSTQTDMITTVLFLLSIYFALILRQRASIKNSLLFDFSIGLGMLTKATFAIYMIIPFALIFTLILKKWKQHLPLVLISLFIIGFIQVRFFQQNLLLYGTPTVQKLVEKEGEYTN